MNKTSIQNPLQGTVITKYAEAGEVTSIGQTTIQDCGHVYNEPESLCNRCAITANKTGPAGGRTDRQWSQWIQEHSRNNNLDHGIRTVLLSGDRRATTEAVAREVRVGEWIAEASPDRKIEVIRELQQKGSRVAMVGDGVNDAPSLAQADLGIALGGGADLAMHAAPLVLMGNSLTGVTETLELARRTFRIVRQNLFWAFVYNTAGITLAVAGVLTPIMAAAAMVLSSVSVIANSRRLQ